MDVRFHCTRGTQKSGKKSAHAVLDQCGVVRKVLAENRNYGVPVSGHGSLRKMRVRVPSLKKGKSGGYRTIYSTRVIDETTYIVFVALYFKSDVSDLTRGEYVELEKFADELLSNPLEHEWGGV